MRASREPPWNSVTPWSRFCRPVLLPCSNREYYAVQEGRFPENTVEPPSVPGSAFCWGTYNYKISARVLTTEQLPQHRHEREIFGKVARKELAGEAVLLEHVGADRTVLPGTFLARTVSVGRDMQTVHTGLHQAREKITHTIS